MGTNNNTVVVSFSIVILLLLSLLLLLTYNSKCNMNNLEHMDNMMQNTKKEKFMSVADQANKSIDFNNIQGTNSQIQPSVSGGNAIFNNVQTTGQPLSGSTEPQNTNRAVENFYNAPYPDSMNENLTPVSAPSQDMQACFPRDRLSAEDLLPKDAADSKWARLNPSGTGDIHDQNYLTAGYHIGVNTVGQSMRNANLQLRSEIPNPQAAVGPWMISTIEPDLRQNTLEIGSSPAY